MEQLYDSSRMIFCRGYIRRIRKSLHNVLQPCRISVNVIYSTFVEVESLIFVQLFYDLRKRNVSGQDFEQPCLLLDWKNFKNS